MSILARIRAHGGDIIRSEWRFSLKRGRLTASAIAWLRAHWLDACAEAWPPFGDWLERAAIREYDGGQIRPLADADAYDEVVGC